MREDILEGDVELQIEALWQYLLEGRQARTPRGLIREPIELLATDEAVMLRRSYPGIGKRGIGVGYPRQLNLAFDAEQMRLAMIWQGKFADPGGVWRGQGHGRVRPLGGDLIQFADGPDIDDAESPWVVDDGRPPDHQFKGYSLDRLRRPRFKYRFRAIEVEDYVADELEPSTGRPCFHRLVTLTSQSDAGRINFRAASGNEISRQPEGTFLVDQRLRVRVDESHSSEIQRQGEQAVLVIPVTMRAGTTKVKLEYRW